MLPQRIIWHHSAIDSQQDQFDKIDVYHKQRGFPKSSLGFYVGYHYVIEASGEIKQARDEAEIGAHDHGENINSIGICICGMFNTHGPSEAQAIAAARLVAGIRSRWKIPITRFEPHRWDDATDCPGRFMEDNWLLEQYLCREANPMHRLFYRFGAYLNLF